ncbi:MAG TPA: TraB/GumN family protein [Tianweitania sediminis]|jgi:hypothetical protein|nr:TraB/GumN family protein [Tianweitania sediminis]
MASFLSLVHRSAAIALWGLGAANLLFILVFLVVLTTAVQSRAAETAACSGMDLVEHLAGSDPAAMRRVEAAAAAIPNGRAIFWRIEKDGVAPSFLLGTMHVADPRVVALPTAAEAALREAATVVIETTDILEPGRMLAVLAEHPDLTMFTDGTSLSSRLTGDQRRMLETRLAAKGLNLNSVNKMKPWMLATVLATPACEVARRATGEPVLDMKIAQEAKAAGKPVLGLETALDQLEAMASLPMDFHLQALLETVALADQIDDVVETMVGLYNRAEIGMIWAALEETLPHGSTDSYSEFERVMVTARNHTMAERAAPLLEAGDAFLAVGALHLPGEEGLVELLRARGFRLAPVQ